MVVRLLLMLIVLVCILHGAALKVHGSINIIRSLLIGLRLLIPFFSLLIVPHFKERNVWSLLFENVALLINCLQKIEEQLSDLCLGHHVDVFLRFEVEINVISEVNRIFPVARRRVLHSCLNILSLLWCWAKNSVDYFFIFQVFLRLVLLLLAVVFFLIKHPVSIIF